ncbi:hypothetical protein EON79_06050, partial [bacterium]
MRMVKQMMPPRMAKGTGGHLNRRPATTTAAFAGGATVFLAYQFVQNIRPELILTLDAAGLG